MTKYAANFKELTQVVSENLTQAGLDKYTDENWYDLKALACKAIFEGAEVLVISGAYTVSGQDLVVVFPNNKKFRKAVGW